YRGRLAGLRANRDDRVARRGDPGQRRQQSDGPGRPAREIGVRGRGGRGGGEPRGVRPGRGSAPRGGGDRRGRGRRGRGQAGGGECGPGRAGAPGAGDTDGGDGPGEEDEGGGGQDRGPPAARWPRRATPGSSLLVWGGDPTGTPGRPAAPLPRHRALALLVRG